MLLIPRTLLIPATIAFIVSAHAAEPTAYPPHQYQLSEVTLQYEAVTSWPAFVAVVVSGDGKVSRVENSGGCAVSRRLPEVTPDEVFRLLQMCYEGHLFELAPVGFPYQRIRLAANGVVEAHTIVPDSVSTETLTIIIGQYGKSVSLNEHSGSSGLLRRVAARMAELGHQPQ